MVNYIEELKFEILLREVELLSLKVEFVVVEEDVVV